MWLNRVFALLAYHILTYEETIPGYRVFAIFSGMSYG
jgi:hypothetical protein